ncbi:MAG: glycosyltransferase family 9 protein [Fusobacterium sp.]|nr:glycosyltransferase family 9 protein [Fusobacterium sp.]
MEIKKILVSRTDKIGDLILSIPSFYMLRRMYPHAEIIVLVRKYNYDIVRNLPYVDRIIKIDDFTKTEFLEKIAYFKADVFIALYNDDYVAELAKASKAKTKIGPISKANSFLTYNKGVLQKRSFSKKNEAEYNLDLIKKLNPNRFRASFEINTDLVLSENNIEVANLYFKENNLDKYDKILVVNPFIGGSAKNLRDEEYVNILSRILEKYGNKLGLIITCHINDEERAEKLKESISKENIFIFANGSSIMNTAGIIEKADVYFGASTGPTHIAGALNKKIVAIYPNKKTQHPTRWGVFNIYSEENVKYIIPDKDNSKENYKNPYFDEYNLGIEDEIVNALEESLSL